MKEQLSFENESIWRLIAKNGVPAMITMIVVLVYNLADTFFVGQTHNDLMVAAVSVTAPIFTLLITIGSLIGGGGCAVISNALGSKEVDRAKQTSSFCFYTSICIGILFAILLIGACNPILHLVGATGDTIGMAGTYLRIIGLGAPFIIFSNTIASVLRANGAAKEAMIGNMLGTVMNIVLDPIMILWFHWGIAGAAIATVIGNVGACVFYLLFIKGKSVGALSYSLSDFTIHKEISIPVFLIGIPGALSNLLMSFSNVMMNRFLLPYGDGAIAAMGVSLKVLLMVSMIQMGLCMGVLPILAYNFGSQKIDRVKETIWKTGFICIILGSFLTLVCYFFRDSLVSAFITDAEIIQTGKQMVAALILIGPIIGLYFLTTNILQAIGKSLWPTIISLSRQGLIYIPCLFILDTLFGLNGLMYAQAISDMIATSFSIIVCIIVIRNHVSAAK